MSYSESGGCLCGNTRYEITSPALFTHVCHCRMCQKLTGSAFWITRVTIRKDFKFTAGGTDSIYVTADSGAKIEIGFCPNCGTRIYSSHENYPNFIAPAVGSLDDPGRVVPQAHIFTRSKLPWVVLPDEVPSFAERYDMQELWPQESIEKLIELTTPAS